MRYTYGTIAAVTCAILVLATFWPQPEGPVIPNVVAQSKPSEGATGDSGQAPAGAPAESGQADPANSKDFTNRRARIEAKLEEPYGEIGFYQMPLRDVIAEISRETDIPMVFDAQLLGNEIDPDVLVDIVFGANLISVKTLLNDLVIKTAIRTDYSYVVRDGYVLITSIENTTEVIVYNCRDLLMPTPAAGPVMAPGGQGDGTAATGGGVVTVPTQFGFAIPDPNASAAAEQQLIQVVSNTVAPGTWNVAGNTLPADSTLGSIDAINGLIVINHTREVHEQVKDLLKLLRAAKNEHGLDGTIYSYPRPAGGFGGGGGSQEAPSGGGGGFF